MSFELNYEKLGDNGLMKPGVYEVTIEKAEEQEYNGRKNISMWLGVRTDVEQEYKNKKIFHNIYKAKDTGKYNANFFNLLGKITGIPEGKKFDSLEALLKELIGKPARVTVEHEEYNGKQYERVKKWETTRYPISEFAPLGDDFDDDDIPF